MFDRRIVMSFAYVVCLACAADVFGQSLISDADVRQEAKQILDEPEFRYFDHLGDSPERPESRHGRRNMGFGTGNCSGGGTGSGTGTGGGGGTAGQQSGRGGPQGRSSSSKSGSGASDSSGGSNSASIPIGGLSGIGGVFGMIFHVLAYGVLIAVCALIVYLIIRAIMSREPSPSAISGPQMNLDVPQEEDHSPGELPADAYLAKARELAEQRKYREAIAHLLLGGMSAIERAQLIRHRRGLTLRDYLRSLRGKAPQYDGFKLLIGLYEPVGFGRRVASYQTFQDALVGYEQAVMALA